MAESRNDRAQLEYDETFDGDSVEGGLRAMAARYPHPLTSVGTLGAVPDLEAELLNANRAFYAAFEGRDLDAMSAVWSHEDHVMCTHPGWASLQGWPAVAASWFALFQGDTSMQFILTREEAVVRGHVGWVSVDENLIAGPEAQTVAAVNVFERVNDGWRLVLHHGSGLAAD